MSPENEKSGPIGSLFVDTGCLSAYCLSVTTGNRESGTVIKVKRKPAIGIELAQNVTHLGRYSMPAGWKRQGAKPVNSYIGSLVYKWQGTKKLLRTDGKI